ncbi:MAG: hypothetical protein BVN34_06355 [Proteobacteria bacterium ST_bin12]|nr:MAG: hypothetical protein BVN34_06355 [Proteobacteria bacterium ST_bin12]
MQEPSNGLSIPYQHAFYIQSMLFNTTSAIKSFRIALTILEKDESGEIKIQDYKERFLDELHNIINQSGAISRYFWPATASPRNATESQKNIHKIRGAFLKDVFDIKEGNPLENRALRNAVEHFDERLDLYLEQGIIGNIFPSLIMNEPDNSGVAHHIFRAYYLKDAIFQILGERFEIEPITDELIKIHAQLTKFDENGGNFSK